MFFNDYIGWARCRVVDVGMAIREFQKFQGSKSSNGSNVHFRHHPSPQQRYLGAQYAKKRAKVLQKIHICKKTSNFFLKMDRFIYLQDYSTAQWEFTDRWEVE